jgi:ElaB/YqjD/DUF883 family membrane-anchored ribosome-binding protein
MGESTDQIRREIDESRQSAADKIDQIQDQVTGTADQMRTNVQETAEQLREQVTGTVEDTIQTVKENVDFRQAIEDRPLLAVGAALVGGFVLGGLTGGDDDHRSSQGATMPNSNRTGSSGSSLGSGLRAAIQKSGIEDTLSNAAAAFVGGLSDQLKETLDRNMPGFADKMSTAQETPGGVAEKARQAQSPTL